MSNSGQGGLERNYFKILGVGGRLKSFTWTRVAVAARGWLSHGQAGRGGRGGHLVIISGVGSGDLFCRAVFAGQLIRRGKGRKRWSGRGRTSHRRN